MTELRYPFDSVATFFLNEHYLSVQALHLTIGLVFLILLITNIFIDRGLSLTEKCFVVYFVCQTFNGPAFQFSGISVPEFFGALGCLLSIGRKFSLTKNPLVTFLSALLFLMIFHFLLVYLHTDLLSQSQSISFSTVRFFLFLKIVVLIGAINTLGKRVRKQPQITENIFSHTNIAAAAAICIYLIQTVIYQMDVTPYGTFLNAGFSRGVSFGATSIERGHFAKQFLPYFPILLAGLLENRSNLRILIFMFFIFVTLINFSASGFAFLFLYSAISCYVFRKSIFSRRIESIIFLSAACFTTPLVFMMFFDQYSAMVAKIVEVGLKGGGSMASVDASGRGISVLLRYINEFPFGMGYGGSTLRNFQNFPENNQGIFAFISQLGPISAFIIALYLYFIFFFIRRTLKAKQSGTMKAIIVGVAAQPFIFGIDILWFQPMLWLPVVFLLFRSGSLNRQLEPNLPIQSHQ